MTFPLKIYKVSGHSMEPALKFGSYVLVNTWNRNYQVGDIAAFTYNNTVFIKRVSNIKNTAYEVVGDNKTDSFDSKNFGLIHTKDLVGKVILY